MIMNMEKKLGSRAINKKNAVTSKISVAQYWDFLTYIDDDYLTDFEILKMKELYYWQL